jgi:hypothetical protein
MSIKKFGQDGEYHQMFNQKKIFIPPKFYFSPQKKNCHFGLYQKRNFFSAGGKKINRFRAGIWEPIPIRFQKVIRISRKNEP